MQYCNFYSKCESNTPTLIIETYLEDCRNVCLNAISLVEHMRMSEMNGQLARAIIWGHES